MWFTSSKFVNDNQWIVSRILKNLVMGISEVNKALHILIYYKKVYFKACGP